MSWRHWSSLHTIEGNLADVWADVEEGWWQQAHGKGTIPCNTVGISHLSFLIKCPTGKRENVVMKDDLSLQSFFLLSKKKMFSVYTFLCELKKSASIGKSEKNICLQKGK